MWAKASCVMATDLEPFLSFFIMFNPLFVPPIFVFFLPRCLALSVLSFDLWLWSSGSE